MVMKLLIVESPAKAKTISKYLDGAYEVVASVGHIRDLPKSNKKAIDMENDFKPHYEISPGKEKVVYQLTELSKEADEVLLAPDPDREGEAIAWHIKEAVGLKKPKRVVFHEITKEAILEALKHPRDIDENLRHAQEARRVLDRLVGYDLSGLIWKKVRYGLSAGRVQSPALRILMEREREIRAFVPETFWVINATVQTSNGKKENFAVTCEVEPRAKKEVEDILAAAESGAWKVIDVTETEVKRASRAPFITSTLQQTASTRLGFSPSRTMSTAQRLYEAGLITYMRTDSTNLSKMALEQIARLVEKNYGKEYLSPKNFAAKSKNAQEAHEAIRPTNVAVEHAGFTDDQKKLYNLIWQRAVSSQMSDAKTLRTKITTAPFAQGGKTPLTPPFAANGSRILFDGWYKADPGARGEDVELPAVKADESLNLIEVASEEKQTEPPPRYSEAGLVKELEKRGIGRPSTYASIIKTIEDRGYVEKLGKALKPTDTGDVVSTFLEQHFADYISDSFTAEMEEKLDLIANGEAQYAKTLKEFYGPFTKEVKRRDKEAEKITNLGKGPKEFPCPECKSDMIIKLGRGGKFLSCDRFPECNGARTIDGKIIEKEKPIGKDPVTGLEIFVLDGRYGPYVQLGEKTKENKKPRKASIPAGRDLSTITLTEALKFLSLPRVLGEHPVTGKTISASIGRFGPYIVHDGDFRSLKTDDVYTIELPRALEILKEEKKRRFGRKAPAKSSETTEPKATKRKK